MRLVTFVSLLGLTMAACDAAGTADYVQALAEGADKPLPEAAATKPAEEVLLYERTRTLRGDKVVDERTETSPRLSRAVVPAMHIPGDVLAKQLGLDVRTETTLRAEGDKLVAEERVWSAGDLPAPTGPALQRDRVTPAGELRAAIARQLQEKPDLMKDDEDRFVVYATFAPEFPHDAAMRVAWLEGSATAKSARHAIEQGERAREADIARAFAETRVRLEALGACKLAAPSPVAHAAYLRCDRAGLDALAGAGLAREIELMSRGVTASMTGEDIKAATGAQTRTFLDRGYDGRHPTRPGTSSHVRVALLDPEGFYKSWNHPAYNWSNGTSRAAFRNYCSTERCDWDFTDSGVPGAHGAIAQVGAFSDITLGQDARHTSTLERSKRSHGAYQSEMMLFRFDWAGGENRAIAKALDYSADIIEISAGVFGGNCDDVDGVSPSMRDSWDNAYSRGAIGVLSAGNTVNRYDNGCTANLWGTRPDILMVGAFGDDVRVTTNGKAATPIRDWAYDTQQLMGWHWTDMSGADHCPGPGTGTSCWSSAYGNANIYTPVGKLPVRSVIDVVAPAGRELGASVDGAGGTNYGVQCCGTSEAGPTAAAVVADVKDWANFRGFGSFNNPSVVHVNMLLMGDGTFGGHAPSAGRKNVGLDPLWGAGRLKARLFDGDGLQSSFGWGTASYSIGQGQYIDRPIGGGPVPSNVDFWAGAVAWDEPWLNSNDTAHTAGDIDMYVITTNPVSGACPNPNGSWSGVSVVASDSSRDVVARVRITPDQMPALRGKCAFMRFYGYSISPGPDGVARRTMFTADYFESQNRSLRPDLVNVE